MNMPKGLLIPVDGIILCMIRIREIKLPLDHGESAVRSAVLKKLSIRDAELVELTIHKRSYDARKRERILLVYVVDVTTTTDQALLERFAKDNHVSATPDMQYKFVARASDKMKIGARNGITQRPRPIVIGTGPCGYFAGLLLAQMGFCPIILERGKAVKERTVDTFGFWRKGLLHTESNVQFGEGGAGTFSDGKLYSQIRDPKQYGRKVLDEFVKAGATDEILYVNKPHIGTLRLVKIVENMRNTITELGGEIRFEEKVEEINIENGQVHGVTLASGEVIEAEHVVLAIGHSARDTFKMLYAKGVYIEPKPISVGFRIEHPQSQIDRCRFGDNAGNPLLGSADYKLVHHCKNGRSVYSFCMCPGGTVVAAASEEGGVVTNGMSQYSRRERNANSGIVVGLTLEDYASEHPLAAIDLQRALEQKAYLLGGEDYSAPGQLIGDFLSGTPSTAFGEIEPSYTPGVHLTDLSDLLPAYATEAMREAIPAFERNIKGFARADGLLTGVETRTSSPIRMKRDETYQSLNTKGLYPAGEGAGYAGGIFSAGVDGIRVAEAVALSLVQSE